MSKNLNLCNDTRLEDLIHDRLHGPQADRLLEHVESCETCQRRMEELAADDTQWQMTADVLSSVGHDVPFDGHIDLDSIESLARQDHDHHAWSESMSKKLLSPPSHPEMLGRIGRYEVERLIGSGGMGVVFKGFDTELNRPVAIKVLAPYLAGSGPARQRFAREARAAAAVVHDHVVPIHNVETEREMPFLVMKFISGESLQARIDRQGPLEVCEILRIAMQVAAGLAAAHQQGLVHRDIKPPNILLEQGLERALITDFGLARAVDDASLTHTGLNAGTPQYMSPEQISGQSIDFRSDLFSLGSVVYAMCTGRPPFRAENSFGIMKRITEDEPRGIREVNPRIPEWLECLVKKLLAKKPEDRPATAHETSELFAHCLAHGQDPSACPLPNSVVALAKKTPKPFEHTGKTQARFKADAFRLNIASRVFAIVVIGSLCVGIASYAYVSSPSGRAARSVNEAEQPAQQWQPSIAEATKIVPPSLELEWESGEAAMQFLKKQFDGFESKLKSSMPDETQLILERASQ
jgi:serine/threonine protein kinase